MPVEPYGYAAVAVPNTACGEWRAIELDGEGNPIPAATVPAVPEADWQTMLEEQTCASYQAGVERGMEEGRAAEREIQQRAHAAERERFASGLAQLAAEFAAQRSGYFEQVEQEVARLALAIAARILRREAQTDPLLLLGGVRVALGQLSGSGVVRLRVACADAELWRDAVALLPHRDLKLEVVADESLRGGECHLETEVGSADLGLRTQLGEIERSFFERDAMPVEPEAVMVACS
jgi:flagellar assembly protein FliH